MKVEQLMTSNVHVCHPQDTLTSAAEKMWTYDIGCLPVIDENRNVIGMITDRDICMAAYTQGRTLMEIAVGVAMSKELYACTPHDLIKNVEKTLRSRQVRRLPVLNQDLTIAGIVSLTDIAREAEREMGLKSHEISTQEVTATLATVGEPREHNGHAKV